uniref:xyloglucan endotransglucosylase/hydrolase protein 2-like n=1 Tax=Fragaria vesca subsp. vesca TaxID=101020 RepID=UPI0005C99946|nr:PREDICTED: xyloglucan endotransglucosylase/hydrolase protein 2-like [Fragaria vesca subsp. vesca]
MIFFLVLSVMSEAFDDVRFDENYVVRYGNDHISKLDQGREVQLSLDLASGSGFNSKRGYGSGFFEMRIKLPARHSPGVVTTFYLSSHPDNKPGNHDELDFEFLGTEGPVFSLQTNIFANDNGNREQRLHLWFDPTKDFHKYGILWNHRQIVFFVDNIPIRVFKNNTRLGARYPSQEMSVEGSIWNGESWASSGKKIEWSQAPFQAHYQEFDIYGCPFGANCSSESQLYWWNTKEFYELTPEQQRIYKKVTQKYMFYDYCHDRGRNFKECQIR